MGAEPMRPGLAIDTLIVVGGQGTAAAMECPRTLAFIRYQAGRARRVCSVCTGAYLLAAAGLLDGRLVTTHWEHCGHFARTFPEVRTEPDRIYTRDGNVWTSAGVTAGIDLALALIGDDLGESAAKQVARRLVVYYRRSGGQSQFSTLLEEERPSGRFGPLLGWIREHICEDLPVERLAEQANMSPRNFARAFVRETGTPPAKWVEKMRLEVAAERIESGAGTMEEIARLAGFRDPERMRRAFLRTYGQPPQAVRRTALALRAGSPQ